MATDAGKQLPTIKNPSEGLQVGELLRHAVSIETRRGLAFTRPTSRRRLLGLAGVDGTR